MAGLSVDYVVGRAEETGLSAGSYDIISAATCWHWFDRAKAAAEARRLLRPEGRLVIASLDWHLVPGNVADLTWKLIMRFNPVKPDTIGRHRAFGFGMVLLRPAA